MNKPGPITVFVLHSIPNKITLMSENSLDKILKFTDAKNSEILIINTGNILIEKKHNSRLSVVMFFFCDFHISFQIIHVYHCFASPMLTFL